MAMTLDQLQALSDEKLIELVAVEVMKWKKNSDFRTETKLWRLKPLGTWNPLTDWNHTMEVRDRILRSVSVDVFSTAFRQVMAEGKKIGDYILRRDQVLFFTHRDLCLAALLALSHD